MELRKSGRAARGLRHVLDVATPTLVFLLGYGIAGPGLGAGLALVAGGVIAAIRLARGDSLRMVRLSVLMVLVYSVSATISGEGRDFFLPEIVLNVALAIVCGVSVLRGTPITARVARRFKMDGAGDPRFAQEHRTLTWMWFGVWASHLVVMIPLYLANFVGVLGLASTLFAKPTAVVMLLVSWRRLQTINGASAPASPAESAESPGSSAPT